MNARFVTDTVIPQRQEKSAPPLSFSQERLWFLDAMGAGRSYHMPVALKLTGRLELAVLREAIEEIVARHEALRTVFPAPAGQPTAMVVQSQTLELHDC